MWDNRKPTNRAPNEPAKSFYMCSGKHIFGQKWPFSVQRSLLFCEGAKVLVPIYQKPLTHLVCIVLLVGHCTKWIRKANIWPKQMHIFWPNLAYFGPKILIFTGGSKSFGTHVTEPPRHLVRIVFWSGKALNRPKMPVFGQIWPFLRKKS